VAFLEAELSSEFKLQLVFRKIEQVLQQVWTSKETRSRAQIPHAEESGAGCKHGRNGF